MFDPRRHTIPIYEFEFNEFDDARPGHPYLRGSGVFVEFCGRPMIATAAHVLESGFRRIGFGHARDGAVHIGHSNNFHILQAEAVAFEGDERRVRYRDNVDVAVIVPSPAAVETLREAFEPYVLDDSFVDHPSQICIVTGWPGELNEADHYNDVLHWEQFSFEAPIGSIAELERIEGDPGIHLSLRYNSSEQFQNLSGEIVEMPESLHGMSGGGVWAADESVVTQTAACAMGLRGLVVEDHNPSQPLLKVIQSRHLREPFRRAFNSPVFHMADRVRCSRSIGHVVELDYDSGPPWRYRVSFAEIPTRADAAALWLLETDLEPAPGEERPMTED